MYVNRKVLETEIAKSMENGKLTEKAVRIFIKMTKEINKTMSYKYEDDKKDCMSEAMFDILKYWNRYDPTLPNANCFSFYTQMIKNGMAKGFKKLRPRVVSNSIPIDSITLNI
jgi:DNA-directed RNA polymerase specialized sigma subunit